MLGLVVAACGSDDGAVEAEAQDRVPPPGIEDRAVRVSDRPLFEKKVKALCGDCEIIYSNADQTRPSSSSRLRPR
jgi:D-xylose transport system substrate-binding protein